VLSSVLFSVLSPVPLGNGAKQLRLLLPFVLLKETKGKRGEKKSPCFASLKKVPFLFGLQSKKRSRTKKGLLHVSFSFPLEGKKAAPLGKVGKSNKTQTKTLIVKGTNS
jgi:hypothetical protein